MKEEKFRVNGEDLLKKVKEIIKEGSVTRLIIKNEDDKTLIEVPIVVGAVGVIMAPMLAAVGAIAALVTNCTILVERNTEEKK
jgi:hypothetical protein